MERGKVGAAEQDVKLVELGRVAEGGAREGGELVDVVQIRPHRVLRGALLGREVDAEGANGRLHVARS